MEDFYGPPISVYTAEQAVEDGVLVSVPADLLPFAAVKAPVYITIGLWGDVEYGGSDDPDRNAEVTRRNIINLLRAASLSFRAGDTTDMMRNDIKYVRSDGRTVTVWGAIDGDGVTLMYPSDY